MDSPQDLKEFVESLIVEQTEYDSIESYYLDNGNPFTVNTQENNKIHLCKSGEFVLVGLQEPNTKNKEQFYLQIEGGKVDIDCYDGTSYTRNDSEIINQVSRWPQPKTGS